MYAAIKLKMRSTGGGVLTVNWAGQKKGGGGSSRAVTVFNNPRYGPSGGSKALEHNI